MTNEQLTVSLQQESPTLYYDYERQCWVVDGKVDRCGHQTKMRRCYACQHAGEVVLDRYAPTVHPPKVGDRVFVNGGFPGAITAVHAGQLHGMVDVRLPNGLVTVDISDLQ